MEVDWNVAIINDVGNTRFDDLELLSISSSGDEKNR
jgi:hypothetical protein